jgi:small subunit ribosomal protein S19e
MVSAHDVPSSRLIGALAEQMKAMPSMQAPEWAQWVKTGSHAERPPSNPDWWLTRAASVMRKLYLHGPVGLSDLERAYGGSKAVYYNPKHHRDAGGSSIRKILHQLESAELVTKTPKGRVLSSKGRAFIDKTSKQVFASISEGDKTLARYA